MTRTLIIAAAAVMLSNAAAVAHTQDSAPQTTVQYADLNLTTDVGVKTLMSRIQSASAKVCAGFGDAGARDLGAIAQARTCRDTAVTQAVARMNIPALSRMAAGTVVTTAVATR